MNDPHAYLVVEVSGHQPGSGERREHHYNLVLQFDAAELSHIQAAFKAERR